MTTSEEVAALAKARTIVAEKRKRGFVWETSEFDAVLGAIDTVIERLQAENKSAGDAGLVVTDEMVHKADQIFWGYDVIEDGDHARTAMRAALEAALSLVPQNSVSTGESYEPFTEGRGAAKVASSPVLAGDWVMVRERLSEIVRLHAAYISQVELVNKSIPDPVRGTRAEREVYQERYQKKDVDQRFFWRALEKLAFDLPELLSAAPKPPASVPLTDDALKTMAKEYLLKRGWSDKDEIPIKTVRSMLLENMRRVAQHAPAQKDVVEQIESSIKRGARRTDHRFKLDEPAKEGDAEIAGGNSRP